MENSTQILDLIKSFDSTYMMSDDSTVYSDGKAQEIEIHSLLKEASNDTLIEVRNSIDLTDRFLKVPFGRYFENLNEVVSVKSTGTEPKSKLSEIMSTAWAMFKSELFESFGLALKASWSKYKLVQSLKNGIARFSYIKSDGSTREAIGTLRNGNFHYKPKGSTKKENSHVVKYFDVVANGFRSLRIDRLIAA